MKFRVLAAIVLLFTITDYAESYDSNRSYIQPGNALVAPFDARDGHTTFLLASNIGTQKLTTHWAFWSESCSHLVDVSICLTQDDTVVVDPTAVQARAEDNTGVGPTINLSGNNGFVTVTAYQTNEECDNAERSGEVLVDNSLIGSYTIANTNTSSSFASNALILGLDETGEFTNLNDSIITQIDAETFSPESLVDAIVYAISLEERAGEGQGFKGEIGPISGTITATASYYDNLEIRTSLPDLSFGCAAAIDLLQYLAPLQGATSGLLRLRNIEVVRSDGSTSEIGGTTGVYGIVGEALGPYGVALEPSYKLTSLN